MKKLNLLKGTKKLFYSNFKKSKEFFSAKDYPSFEKETFNFFLKLIDNPVHIPNEEFLHLTELYEKVGKEHVFKELPLYKALQFISFYYEKLQKFDEAIKYQQLALDKCHSAPNKGLIHINLGGLYQKTKEYQKSCEFFMKGIIDIGDNINEENSSHVAHAHLCVAKYLLDSDKETARENLEKAFAMRENFFGYKHSETIESGYLLGKMMLDFPDKMDTGISVLEKVFIAIDVSSLPPGFLTEVGLLLGKAYSLKKKYQAQQNILTRTFHTMKRSKGLSLEEYEWLQYKIENMLAACKVLKEEVNLGSFLFQKVIDNEFKNFRVWSEKYKQDFDKELSKRHFYYGIACFKTGKFEKAKDEFEKGQAVYRDKLKDEKFSKVIGEYIEECNKRLSEKKN